MLPKRQGFPFMSLVVFMAMRFFQHSTGLLRSAFLLWGALLCVQPLRAFERVNLRNGFFYDCTRREPLDSAHVRLHLLTEQLGAANYVDLPVDVIAGIETLPDPPPASLHASVGSGSIDVPSLLTHAGTLHNIDAELLASIVHAESGGRIRAVSRVGAEGLMQLMPGTAAALGVVDAFRPDQNVAGGTAYFDALLTRYHDNLPLALAAYNAGPGAVDHYHGVPPFRETRAYVARVMTEFKRRKLALQQTAQNTHPAH